MFGLASQAGACFDVLRVLIGLHHDLEHAGDFLRAYLVMPSALTGLDDLTESHGTLHGVGHFFKAGFVQPHLGQRLPAAHDFCGISHLQLVLVVLQQFLQLAVDMAFFHGQHDNLVVHQQPSLDGFRERDDVQLFPILRRVVHRVQCGAVPLRNGLGLIAIDARRRRHVQALCPLQVCAVMYAYKSTFLVTLKGGTRGTVRLVADDQIKGG